MRRIVPALLAAGACALIAPSGAHAAATVGVSDQQYTAFSNPLFAPLHFKVARYIAPYDTADDSRQKAAFTLWYLSALKANQKILVAFEHSRASSSKAAQAPSVSTYTSELKKFKAAFPKVSDITAWNEDNVCQKGGRLEGQPTKICSIKKGGPALVAKYYSAAKKVYKGHTVAGLDILDGANVGGAISYIRAFKKHANPKVWGIHNYSDTNRGSTSRTSRIIKTIGSKGHQFWLTETGGQLRLQGKEFGEASATKALGCMFYIAHKYTAIKRLYVYQFTPGAPGADFDAGLINPDNTPRTGYAVVQQRKATKCKPQSLR